MTSYYPNPNLLDDVSIDQVRLLPSIKRALVAAGLETVGDVRKTPDAMLLSFQNLGQSSVTRLRNELGRRDRALRLAVGISKRGQTSTWSEAAGSRRRVFH